MKKQYIHPTIEESKMAFTQRLCAVSEVFTDVVTGGDVPLDPGSGM